MKERPRGNGNTVIAQPVSLQRLSDMNDRRLRWTYKVDMSNISSTEALAATATEDALEQAATTGSMISDQSFKGVL